MPILPYTMYMFTWWHNISTVVFRICQFGYHIHNLSFINRQAIQGWLNAQIYEACEIFYLFSINETKIWSNYLFYPPCYSPKLSFNTKRGYMDCRDCIGNLICYFNSEPIPAPTNVCCKACLMHLTPHLF